MEQFWHVYYAVSLGEMTRFKSYIAENLEDAHQAARRLSIGTHATITSREGYVATYVGGKLYAPKTDKVE